MRFPYGIAPESLTRWLLFEHILQLQERRGPEVGKVALARVVDSELEAIARATEAAEKRNEKVVAMVRKQV